MGRCSKTPVKMNQETPVSGRKIRVLLVSSVRPELTSGGQIVLYRHLCNNQEIDLFVHNYTLQLPTLNGIIQRFLGRISRSRFNKLAEDLWVLWGGLWLDKSFSGIAIDERTVVLTVAQGNAYPAASKLAKRHGIPLISIFHDWSPDMTVAHSPFRFLLERRFRKLYIESQLALCVSEGMKSQLGDHPNAQVLYPIAAEGTAQVQRPATGNQLKVLYFGNLYEYGPMLQRALIESQESRIVRIEARGAAPCWPETFRQQMLSESRWHEYAPRNEFQAWIESADAFLVPMVFDPSMRRRMETSFPSKLVEMAQLGKPLVIWGPEYCSAVRWASDGDRALCVTDPDPKALRIALEKLESSQEMRQRLSKASAKAAAMEFSPSKIQITFIEALRRTLQR